MNSAILRMAQNLHFQSSMAQKIYRNLLECLFLVPLDYIDRIAEGYMLGLGMLNYFPTLIKSNCLFIIHHFR